MAAAIAAYLATCIDYGGKLSPGEPGVILVLAASRSQAGVVFSYITALIEASPILRKQIVSVGSEEVRLKGNIVIAVHANSFRTVRGRTLLAAIFDECAFWRDESSANPDTEVYRATLPALATTNGMLVVISSPYRRTGLIATKHRDAFGRDDNEVLVVQGGTPLFNPLIDQTVISRARESDPVAAASEWDAQFRVDLVAFLSDELIDAAVDHSRPLELPPRPDVKYFAFTDASAGRHDAFCLAICHREGERVVCDVLRGRRPPFDPVSVTKEYAALVKEYRTGGITGDAYAGNWVSGAFRDNGVEYTRSPKNRSELYLETLACWTRGCVSIPDHRQLTRELRLLERRTARSGKDSVDHGPSGSDDYANALAGALWLASRPDQQQPLVWPEFIPRGPRTYFGDHPGWGFGGVSGSATNPALASGSEYSGNGGAGAHRRGGW